MTGFLSSLSSGFAAIPNALRPHRWWVLLSALILTVFMGMGLTRFAMDVTMDSWFQEDDPVLQTLDEFRAQFGSDDGLYIVYEAKDGDVFSEQSLTLIDEFTQRLKNWQDLDAETLFNLNLTDEQIQYLSHIKRVQSLTNIRIQVNEGDSLISPKLVQKFAMSEAEREALKATAMVQNNLPLFLFSKDFRFGAVMVSTDFGAMPVEEDLQQVSDDLLLADDFDSFAEEDFSAEFDATAEVTEVRFQDMDSTLYLGFMAPVAALYSTPAMLEQFNFYPIGGAAMVDLAMDTMMTAMYLSLGMVVIIVVLLWRLFHSVSAVLWPLVAIGLSAMYVVGATSWMGIATSQLISLTVMLIVAVGVADCVHVMSSYQYFLRKGLSHKDALTEAYGQTGLPILLTTITTMAGMSALAATGMTQFVIFGLTSAAGVLMAFIYTVVLLPVLLDFWHPRIKVKKGETEAEAAKRHWLQPLLDKMPAFVQRHRHLVNIIFIGTFGICLYGATQVKIDSNFAELYREGTTLRTAYEVVDGNMSGTGMVEIMVDMGSSDALYDPQVLQTMADLQIHVESTYSQFVVSSNSLADVVMETHAVMQDGSDAYRTIPADATTVSQLLYLFNSANPEERRALVNDDYSASHINVTLLNAGSSEYSELYENLTRDIDEAFAPLQAKYPDLDVHTTGTLAMMMRLMDDLSRSQFQSLAFAVIIISLLMVLTLGSVQAGLMAIIPNLIPATLTFGLMGLLDIPLDGDTLMIAPLIIGIAVDDTIHFITHYRMALAKYNDMKIALVKTIKEVGQAVTFTSLILGCGFFMLSFSDYLGLAKMGMFGSLAIFVALLCDLLFFPALIMWFKPRFGQKDVKDNLDFKGA